ncbi:urease accessory protein UreD [Calderihabitans maritimus]|uniref:Urease accessory protein UreD n=1 Tax=Calderihabitans maritimus TaxID=1246530 RepID=A0A1Z5HTY7_9FIRM|nr:urease accessory protein UreD [Calderihabitans maritimus]GAW92785.1 urease accessory protein ureD [Calderihabitans maritimus]
MRKKLIKYSLNTTRIGKEGRLYIRLAMKDGYTYIADSYGLIPLKIAKPFYLDSTGEIFLYVLNPTGGIVQGDRYHMDVLLEPGAQAFITSQAATKVYRMECDYASATEFFEVGEGALLEYFPEPIIPFAGARFAGEMEVKLNQGSTAFIGEVLFPGRAKRGEIFEYDFFNRKTKVFYQGEIVYYDWLDLRPKEIKPDSFGIFEGYTHYGQLMIFSNAADRNLSDLLHVLLQNVPGIIGGASLTWKHGIIVRALSSSGIHLTRALTECWDLARRKLIGRSLPKIRKY